MNMPRLIIYTCAFGLMGLLSYTTLSQPQSQQRMDKSTYFDYNETFFCEAHALPSPSKDSTLINIGFRMMYDLLDFRQLPTSATLQRGMYSATPTVIVEIRDDIGIIRYRNQWKDSIYTKTFEQTNSKTDFEYGAMNILLPVGKYSLTAILSEKENSQLRKVQIPSIRAPSLDSVGISKPIFVEYFDTTSHVVVPLLAGGNALFSTNNIYAILILSNVKDGDVYWYNCAPVANTNTDIISEWGNIPEVGGRAIPILNTYLSPKQNSGQEPPNKPIYTLTTVASSSLLSSFGLLTITLPASTIAPGKYKLSVAKVGTKDTAAQQFEVVWENMPLAFRSTRYLVESLYYIVSDDDFDAINSGSDVVKRRNVVKYWQKTFPSNDAVFNSTMAEYYRRVDYAYFNFQAIGESDGSKSDRGKIYILHGSPTSIEKNIQPGGQTQEIWKYSNKVKKEFIFELNSSSIYKLKEIIDVTAK